MFQNVCRKIVIKGISAGNIRTEEKEEYLYGMNIFLNVCLNIVSMIIIGIMTHRLWQCITFCIVHKSIRKYTGGFHFESALFCYISSCIMYFVLIGTIKYIPFRIFEVSIVVLVSSVIIWLISPIEAINKPLDDCEKIVFKKRARINIVIMFVVYSISTYISKEIAQIIAVSIICVMFFALVGKMKNIIYSKKI